MPWLVRNVCLSIDEPEENVLPAVARRLRVPTSAIRHYAIVRRALDARRKKVEFCYQVEVALEDDRAAAVGLRHRSSASAGVVRLEPSVPVEIRPGSEPLPQRPIVVGFGPGGMFAALRLAMLGYRPIVIERGRDVRRRHRDIMQRFYREGEFDESSNLLFGEGGAGTYSDGKLYTRVNDPLCRTVLEVLYQHGADPDILIDTRPHIGSDRLPTICRRIRQRIEELGGEIRFEQTLDDLRVDGGRLTGVRLRSGAASRDDEWLPCGPVVLAVGHSARDTYHMLNRRGVQLLAKPFQIGVRIEHPQAMVDRWQYGAAAGHVRLAPAEYHAVAKGAAGSCGDMFSFCMCPGGIILPSNESAGLVATNGASRSQRSGAFANSGLVITVDPQVLLAAGELKVDDPEDSGSLALAAVAYQKHWERLAFEATGANYRVPAQRAQDLLNQSHSDGALNTSYPLGGAWVEVARVVPVCVVEALRRGLPRLEGMFPGFAGPEALLTAPETRASAPVRIPREVATRVSVSADQLYPVGEGAGYAGGIISAAVDGLRTADAIVSRYAVPR